jgi:hypothetical protein
MRTLWILSLVSSLSLGAGAAAMSWADNSASPQSFGTLGVLKKVEPLGWTADGRTFVFRAEIVEPWAGIPDDSDEIYQAKIGVVLDAVTGEPLPFVLSWKGEHVKPETLKTFGKKRPQEFEAWLKAHPLQMVTGAASPDGKVKAQIALSGHCEGAGNGKVKLSGAWKKDVYSWGCADGDAMGGDAKLVFSVTQGDKLAAVLRWNTSTFSGGQVEGSVRALFSPDGRRVAWVVYRPRESGEVPQFYEVLLSGAVSPRVQVKPDKQSKSGDLIAALQALDRAGFVANPDKVAADHREATIVYAAPGLESAAARLAAALPAGAKVETLTWKPDADIVVALGAVSK